MILIWIWNCMDSNPSTKSIDIKKEMLWKIHNRDKITLCDKLFRFRLWFSWKWLINSRWLEPNLCQNVVEKHRTKFIRIRINRKHSYRKHLKHREISEKSSSKWNSTDLNENDEFYFGNFMLHGIKFQRVSIYQLWNFTPQYELQFMYHQNDNFAVFISIWLSKSSIAQLKTERCNYIIYSSMKCYRLHQITCWTEPIGQFRCFENTYSLDLSMSSILKTGIVSGRFILMLWPPHSRMFCRVNHHLSHAYLRWTK